MSDTMQTGSPTKAVVGAPKQANLLACRQWWKVCFLYGDQQKYYRQVYGRAASQRMAQSSAGEEEQLEGQQQKGEANNRSNENLLNATEKRPQKEVLLFPHKNHQGILVDHQQRGPFSFSPSPLTEDQQEDQQRRRCRVTVLNDPFLLGAGLQGAPHDSKDSGINNMDDPPPPPLPQKPQPNQFQGGLGVNWGNQRVPPPQMGRTGAPPPVPPPHLVWSTGQSGGLSNQIDRIVEQNPQREP